MSRPYALSENLESCVRSPELPQQKVTQVTQSRRARSHLKPISLGTASRAGQRRGLSCSALMWSHLEHCVPLWAPQYTKNTAKEHPKEGCEGAEVSGGEAVWGTTELSWSVRSGGDWGETSLQSQLPHDGKRDWHWSLLAPHQWQDSRKNHEAVWGEV